ncbi:MAG: hypothetical protein FJ147_11300 [Deltaproteobacteria bacterium]|nr:hypothetical protein [Deltaproteobacteria bacterium]
MFTIATATTSYAEVGFWLGVLVWAVFLSSTTGIILSALRGNLTTTQPHAATKSEQAQYQHAA